MNSSERVAQYILGEVPEGSVYVCQTMTNLSYETGIIYIDGKEYACVPGSLHGGKLPKIVDVDRLDLPIYEVTEHHEDDYIARSIILDSHKELLDQLDEETEIRDEILVELFKSLDATNELDSEDHKARALEIIEDFVRDYKEDLIARIIDL